MRSVVNVLITLTCLYGLVADLVTLWT